jgi:hypothetical protein
MTTMLEAYAPIKIPRKLRSLVNLVIFLIMIILPNKFSAEVSVLASQRRPSDQGNDQPQHSLDKEKGKAGQTHTPDPVCFVPIKRLQFDILPVHIPSPYLAGLF